MHLCSIGEMIRLQLAGAVQSRKLHEVLRICLRDQVQCSSEHPAGHHPHVSLSTSAMVCWTQPSGSMYKVYAVHVPCAVCFVVRREGAEKGLHWKFS